MKEHAMEPITFRSEFDEWGYTVRTYLVGDWPDETAIAPELVDGKIVTRLPNNRVRIVVENGDATYRLGETTHGQVYRLHKISASRTP
jgi:hypothetical protein